MPYKRLQFIAYVLNTTFQPSVTLPAPANPRYRGLADPAQDIAARAALVARVLATARAQALGGADTLKIFMMPEFFFRGITGAYDMDGVQRAIKALTDLVKSDDWADWLFVFGTIVGSAEPRDGDIAWTDWRLNMSSAGPLRQKWDIYNFSLVRLGGSKAGDADTHVVMKDSISDKDFISQVDGALPLLPPELILHADTRYVTGGAAGPGAENQFFNHDGSGIFDCAGIRFGMEICLDHSRQRLVQSPQIPGETQVQVQLMSSCGMLVLQPSLLIDATGYAFCCDGSVFGATAGQPNAAPRTSLQGVVVNVPADPLAIDGATVTLDQLFGPALPYPEPNGQGVRSAAPGTEAGAIVVYPAVNTPPRSTVPGLTTVLTDGNERFKVEVVLIYDDHRQFTGASAVITDQLAGLNDLAHMIPVSLSAVDNTGVNGAIALTRRAGSAGYDYAIACESNLAGFKRSGIFVEFGKNYGAKMKTTWTLQPAPGGTGP